MVVSRNVGEPKRTSQAPSNRKDLCCLNSGPEVIGSERLELSFCKTRGVSIVQSFQKKVSRVIKIILPTDFHARRANLTTFLFNS